jgi:hypothetical protein
VGGPNCQRSRSRCTALACASIPLVACWCFPCLCISNSVVDFEYCATCNCKACPACTTIYVKGTTLHIAACLNARVAVLRRLLDIGGRELLEVKDSSGKTAREVASSQANTDAVAEIDQWTAQQEALEKAWQDADSRNTSFIQAARDKDIATLKTLITQGVDLFVQDAVGCTALHRAAEGGHDEVASLLVQSGGQRLAVMTNKDGKTARDLAVLQQRELTFGRSRLDLFVEKTGKIRTDMVPILDAAVDQLELGAFQEQTDLRPADNHEAKFLRVYKEEQEQLRRDAAQLLNEGNVCRQEYFRLTKQLTQQLRQLDEQHKAALRQADEQHKAAMLPIESQLQSVKKCWTVQ